MFVKAAKVLIDAMRMSATAQTLKQQHIFKGKLS